MENKKKTVAILFNMSYNDYMSQETAINTIFIRVPISIIGQHEMAFFCEKSERSDFALKSGVKCLGRLIMFGDSL